MLYCRFLGLLWLCLIGFFALAACVPQPFSPKPAISGVELSGGQAADLFRQLRLKDWEVFNLRSLWRVVLSRADEKAALRYVIVYQRPDCLRLEVLPVGVAHALNLVIVKGGQAILLDTPEKTAYRGYAIKELLQKVLKVPLAEGDLISLLLARIPHYLLSPSDDNHLRAFYDETAQMYAVFTVGFGKYYLVDKANMLLRRVEMRDMFSDELVLRVQYDDFSFSGNVELPGKVLIYLPQEKLSVELELVSVNLNLKIADRVFEVEIPPDYRVKTK